MRRGVHAGRRAICTGGSEVAPMRKIIGILAVACVAGLTSPVCAGTGTVTGTVRRVDRATGRVTVHVDGEDLVLRYPREAARKLRRGDRIAVARPAADAPRARGPAVPPLPDLKGDPGPPAAEIPAPSGYPLGPGMGPIGAGSPNAGPGSPVGADGAR